MYFGWTHLFSGCSCDIIAFMFRIRRKKHAYKVYNISRKSKDTPQRRNNVNNALIRPYFLWRAAFGGGGVWQGKTGSISRFPLNSFFKPDVETKAREVWMQWTGRGLSQAVQSQSQIVVVSLDIQYTITRPDLLHGSPIHLSLANWNKMSLASHSHVRSWTIAPHPLHSQTSAYSEKIQ